MRRRRRVEKDLILAVVIVVTHDQRYRCIELKTVIISLLN
jgi:hypothetical protein